MKRFRYISFIWLVIALGLGTTTRAATSRNVHTSETLSPGSITSNLISEGFDTESFPPVGWVETIVSDPGADPDWSRASTEGEVTAYTGLGMARFNSRMAGEGASARLETPVFAGSEAMTVSFWMLHDYTNSYDSDYIQPQISTDGGTNYTGLSALVLRYDAACGNPCWKQHTFDLDEYAGESNLKVGLLAVSSGGNHMFIDDFLIRVPGPDFQNSTISAPEIAVTDDLITYNLLLTNNGDENASSTTLTDPLPSGVDYLTGSLTCSAGICNYDSGSRTVSWNGSINLGETITITAEGDSDGRTMWVGSGFKFDETREIVQQGFLYRSINCAWYPPTLVINPSALEIQLTPGTKRVIPVSFENTGDLNLEWELEEKSPLNWLSVDPISGLINSKKVSSVNMTFDAAGLETGVYTGVLQVTSNDPIHPLIEVPVTLQVDFYEVYLPTIAR